MNYGLYLSASGVLTNLYRQDVFANNLANVQTIGFKRDLASVRQRDPQTVENPGHLDASNQLLDQLGGGVLAGPQRISFAAGSLLQTAGPLDAALTDPHAFFAVLGRDPHSDQNHVRLTRDGRFFQRDGYLVTHAGRPVLDVDDQPIGVADDAPIQLDGAGRVIQDGQVLAQLQIVNVADLGVLQKDRDNLLRWTGDQDPRRPATDRSIRPGYLEASAVDPIKALMELVSATKAVTANANMIRYHDTLMDRAVNTLGRVA